MIRGATKDQLAKLAKNLQPRPIHEQLTKTQWMLTVRERLSLLKGHVVDDADVLREMFIRMGGYFIGLDPNGEYGERFMSMAELCHYAFENEHKWPDGLMDLWLKSKKDGGASRPKPAEQIVQKYGTVIGREIINDITIQHSYYDRPNGTFRHATAKQRVIEARHWPEIETWLKIFAGENFNKLRDWLATAYRFDRQTSILIAIGQGGGGGKNMLAKGIAMRFSEDGTTTSLSDAIGSKARFSDRVSRVPFLRASESLPEGTTSTDLRRVSGEDSSLIEEKHQPKKVMYGAPRWMIDANSVDVLRFSDKFGASDRDAIKQRLFIINVPAEAARHLEQLGGREATEGWPQKIQETITHWEQTVKVVPGTRFMVEGNSESLNVQLSINDALRKRVVSALAVALSKLAAAAEDAKAKKLGEPAAGADAKRIIDSCAIIVGKGTGKAFEDKKGKLFVNGSNLLSIWKVLAPGEEYKTPEDGPLHDSLLGIALDPAADPYRPKTPKGKLRYLSIDPSLVLGWAERVGIGDNDAMKAVIDGDLQKAETLDERKEKAEAQKTAREATGNVLPIKQGQNVGR